MAYTTKGSIRSFKIDSSKVSISVKGLANYSNKFDDKEYLLLIEECKTAEDKTAKYVKSESYFDFTNQLLCVTMSLLTEAIRSKMVLKFFIEETGEKGSFKYQITCIEQCNDDKK